MKKTLIDSIRKQMKELTNIFDNFEKYNESFNYEEIDIIKNNLSSSFKALLSLLNDKDDKSVLVTYTYSLKDHYDYLKRNTNTDKMYTSLESIYNICTKIMWHSYEPSLHQLSKEINELISDLVFI